MAAIKAMATLYPDSSSNASYAIDGNTQIGRSGGTGWQKCASTLIYNPKNKFVELRYLKIDLRKLHYISAITLHLRDNSDGWNRRSWQNGLTVELINPSNGQNDTQCGDTYNAAINGQSPYFPCSSTTSAILITLRRKTCPLQICEVEAFGGLNSQYWYV